MRLFVSYAKGLTKVYTLLHYDLAGWQLDKKRTYTFSHDSLVDPLASFVLDVSTGDELSLDPTRLQSLSLLSLKLHFFSSLTDCCVSFFLQLR